MRPLRLLAVAVTGLLIAAGVFGVFSPVMRVAAAGYTVDETTDEGLATPTSTLCLTAGGHCSLRAAIQASNNAGGSNTIALPAGTYNLSSSLGELQVGPNGGMSVSISGAGAASTVINASQSGSCTPSTSASCFRVFDVDPNVNGGVGFSASGVTISGGRTGEIGGAGILNGTGTASQPVDTTTLSNCAVSDNVTYSGSSGPVPGGGIAHTYGTVSLTNCTFSNNISSLVGGAVDVEAPGGGGTPTLTVTNSSFTGNSATIGGGVNIANTVSGTISNSTFTSNVSTGNGGAAVGVNSGSMSLANDTLTGNQAQGSGNGGAVYTGGGSTTIQYSRIVNNTAGLGHTPQVFNNTAGASTHAENDWWGLNAGPGSGIAHFSVSQWQVLTSTASPNPIVVNQTSAITASLDGTNLGGSIAPSHHLPDGVSVGFANGALGSVSPSSAILTGGSAGTTYTAGSTGGIDGAPTTIDGQTVSASITVDQPPAITSGNATTFVVGNAGTFPVTSVGFPLSVLSETGPLPSGVTFVDNGDDTATLSGTPAPGTGGIYPLTIKAANGIGTDAAQGFTLTIDTAHPTISTTATPNAGPTGSTLQDSATLAGTGALSGGSITFNLYGPGDPTCSTVLHSETVTGIVSNGPTGTTTGYVANAAGTYNWTAGFTGDGSNAAASTACGAEPVVITANPTLETSANPNSGPTGSTLQDGATLLNASNLDGSGSITFNLYGPGDTTCASPIDTETVTGISGNGPFTTTAGFVGSAAGTYEWTAGFSGDSNNAPASSGCGSEPVVITANATIATTASPSTGPIGSTLQDSALLTNTSNLDGTGSITFNLYGPGDTTCATVIHTETVTGISSNGPFSTTTGFLAAAAGRYNWTASFSGDSHNAAAASNCGAEPVIVARTQGSEITTTSVSCSQFAAETAPSLAQFTYRTRTGTVRAVSRDGFIYWVAVTSTGGNQTFDVTQSPSETSNNFLVTQSVAYTAACARVTAHVTQSGNTVTVKFRGRSAGTTLYIALTFATSGVVGEPNPAPSTTVQYQFSTTGTAASTTTIDLVKR